MTMPANARKFGERLPSATERAAANQLRKILAAQLSAGGRQEITVADASGETGRITLTPAMSELLIEVMRYIGRGDAVTLVPVSQMLTTQQAADVLNVSRPYLISLLDRGDIPHTMVGRHRRVRAEDLFAYKAARGQTRAKALAELAEQDADLI